jgi:alpha-glucosidase
MLPSRSSAFCLLALFGVSGSMPVLAQSSPVEVSSPNHQIAVRFSVQAGNDKQAGGSDGQLVYVVTFHGKRVFEDSALRLELENQAPLGTNVHIARATTGSGADDYRLLAGKTSAVHDSYNSLTLQARESSSQGRVFEIEARVYDSGWHSDIGSRHNLRFRSTS